MEYRIQLKQWHKRRLKMRALFEAGMSLAEIGRKFDISRERARQICKDINKDNKAENVIQD